MGLSKRRMILPVLLLLSIAIMCYPIYPVLITANSKQLQLFYDQFYSGDSSTATPTTTAITKRSTTTSLAITSNNAPPQPQLPESSGNSTEVDAIILLLQHGYLQQMSTRLQEFQWCYADPTTSMPSKRHSKRHRSKRQSINQPGLLSRCPNVISAHCTSYCGGVGDRWRGLVAVFYTAVAMNSLFRVTWLHPNSLDSYFDTTLGLFGVGTNRMLDVVESAKVTNLNNLNFIDDEGALTAWESPARANSILFGDQSTDHNRIAQIVINSLLPLELLSNNSFPGFRDFASFSPVSLTTAALRLLLSRPTPRLLGLVNQTLHRLANQQRTVLIGVQLRLENSNWGEKRLRVRDDQVGCFIAKALEIVKLLVDANGIDQSKIGAYVTSDSQEATNRVVSELNAAKILTIPADGSPLHLDRTFLGPPGSDRLWNNAAKSYADWIVLTRMDYLVISRSGFAETASLYSMKPTVRFRHNSTECQFEAYRLNSLRME